jgi:hypothetical protein
MAQMSQKDNFLERSKKGWLRVTRWRPSTGIGHFDVNYSPAVNLLTIHVALHFEFLTQRAFARQEGKDDWDSNPELPTWTDAEMEAYKTRFKSIVEQVWSRQYRFESKKDGWEEFKANVDVVVGTEAPRGNSHYVIRVVKVPEDKSFRAMCAHDPIWDGQFCQRDVMYEVEKKRDQSYALFAMGWLDKAIERTGCDFLTFDQKSVALTTAATDSLARFAEVAKRHINEEFVKSGLKIWVYAKHGNNDGGWGTSGKRSKAITNHLKKILAPFGDVVAEVGKYSKQTWIKEPMEANLNRRTKLTAQAIGARDFGGGMLLVRNRLKNTEAGRTNEVPGLPRHYIVATHEFGHMLGLPDEYFGVQCDRMKNEISKRGDLLVKVKAKSTNDRLESQQEGFSSLISAADVPAPIMGTSSLVTDSIMYAGHQVLPAHYVTFFEALINITHPYLQARDWNIVSDNPNNFIHSHASK